MAPLLQALGLTFNTELQEVYLPVRLTAKDYSGLMKEGSAVDTIAIGTAMAVFNRRPGGARHWRVVKFIDTFFSKFNEFRKSPRHPKWKEVNLAAKLPGWTRYAYARQWLAKNRTRPTSMRDGFKKLVSGQMQNASLSRPKLDAQFKEFMRWQQTRQ